MAKKAPKQATIRALGWGELEGGLVRMMERFLQEGTLTGSVEEDDFIRRDPTAALLGLLYDQRVRAEYAFTGPHRLRDRLGHLDLKKIAKMDLEDLRAAFAEKPAVHRFTNRMCEMTHELAQFVTERYRGKAANIWNDGAPFEEVERRARELPGFGPQKAEKLKYVLHYFGFRDFAEE
ncbi:MAG TPA: hypothetical protein VF190_12975 [Rhodothermales bacterium]